MTRYTFTEADVASFERAKALCGPQQVVVDLGINYERWHDGDGPSKERYCVRPAAWVKPYKFDAVWGALVLEDKRWYSPVGEADDFRMTIVDTVIDGKTRMGPWALMTPESHAAYGCGLGMGQGQRYRLRPDGIWIKVEG